MQLLQGRVDDFIVLPSGRCLSPRMVNPAFENLPGILEHVLVQEAPDWIVAHLNVRDDHRTTTPDMSSARYASCSASPFDSMCD